MMKLKSNQTRTYDGDGYKKRAACLCFRSESEEEVRGEAGPGTPEPPRGGGDSVQRGFIFNRRHSASLAELVVPAWFLCPLEMPGGRQDGRRGPQEGVWQRGDRPRWQNFSPAHHMRWQRKPDLGFIKRNWDKRGLMECQKLLSGEFGRKWELKVDRLV